ncbi:MAG TPA: YjbE family putative metal transport protein, partial [Rhodocyclaceae bacterium]|nr:YjbE family putative metal transport protein [Rhodocyclaceae bacterium]
MLVLLTLFAVELLQLPWLKLVGSIMLLWVGIQLMEQNDEDADIKEATSLLGAIKTILIADLVMSLDNVLAVAGTAHSAPAGVREFLVVIGLSLSIPVVIFGSKLVLKLMERFSIIVTLGAMLIGWIAGEMFASEPIVETHVVHVTLTMHYVFAAVGVLLVVAIAKWRERRRIERVEAAQ